jgi:NADP-dependent 3-hydroxy acid dehydrogenase YdfG
VKTAALEWPKAACKAIDLQRGGRSADALAQAIVEELLGGGPEREVGLAADGRRVVPVTRQLEIDGGALPLGQGDVVVASGGARGVTAATMIALAEASKARFVLLGRTPVEDEPAALAAAKDEAALKKALLAQAQAKGEKATPAAINKQVAKVLAGREVRATVAAIEAAGGRARYVAADVSDAAALGTALADVRAAWGPITAIVHGAGVLADRFLVDKTLAQFDAVFDTKTVGLRALLDATAADPLKAVLLFSSVAARAGNTGQADYATANSVLDAVAAAEAARRPGCVVRAIEWGPWRGGMVSAELERRFEQLGVTLIPLAEGARRLVDELRAGPAGSSGGAVVLIGSPPAGSLLSADAVPEVTAAIRVDAKRWPWLGDHRVKGEVVVPVVVAVEWIARAARACRPDLVVTEVRDLEVVRGIRVDGFDAGGAELRVHARQLENGDGATVLTEIRDPDGKVRYRARVRLEDTAPTPIGVLKAPEVGPWEDRTVYDGRVLFHGPAFQVVKAVGGVGDEGLTATLDGLVERGWDAAGWVTDPAALDGLLQLGVLWTERGISGASLPTGVGSLQLFRPGPVDGPVQAFVRRREVGRDHARFDAALVDSEGRIVVELKGVSTHRLPGEGPARSWTVADAEA